jgi:hypothetical protein
MLATHRTAIGLLIIVLGSIAAGQSTHAQDGNGGKPAPSGTSSGGLGRAAGMFQEALVDGRAPIGHRQPRPGDIPADARLSMSDRVLREEDDRIDKKLTICRGC